MSFKRRLCILILSIIVSAAPCALAAPNPGYIGGTFVTAVTGDPPHLNRYLTTDVICGFTSGFIFSTLVGIGTNFDVVPDLAKSWEMSPDGKTYTFNLYPNPVFHDGTPLTSEDVAFSFRDDMLKISPYYGSIGPYLSEVLTPDDLTVVFKLSIPLPYFLSYAGYNIPILPKHIYNGTDILTNEYNSKPVGSGPFKFLEWVKGSHITLVKNENFFRTDDKGIKLPYLDKIVVKIMPDSSARVTALDTGEIDYLSGFPYVPSEWQRHSKDPLFNVTFLEYHGAAIEFVFLNLHDGVFAGDQGTEIRQAITYGVNKSLYVERVFYGAGKAAPSIMPTVWVQYLNTDAKQPEYDPSKAIDLLNGIGYNSANPLRFRITYEVGRGTEVKCAEIFKAQMDALDGAVEAELRGLEAATIKEVVGNQWDFEAFIVSISVGAQDPVIALRRVLHSENIKPGYIPNLSGYNNTEMDNALEGANEETDETERKQHFFKIQELVARDIPMICLFEKYNPSCYRNDHVGGGLGESPGGSRMGYAGGNNFAYVWLKTAQAPEETLWGLSLQTAYTLIAGVIVAAIVIPIAAVYLRKRRSKSQ